MKKDTPPESKNVPYHFIVCKVKGCVRLHDSFYPMCNKHLKKERKD